MAGFCQAVWDLECSGILQGSRPLSRYGRGGCGCHGPCAVEVHARCYKERLAGDCGCHGLAPWRFTLAATKSVSRGIADATALRRGGSRSPLQGRSRGGLRMPRPCAVEVHVRRYKERPAGDYGCHGLAPWRFTFAAKNGSRRDCGCHGLAPWSFTFAAKNGSRRDCGCHGLAPWRFTLAATKNVSQGFADATALRRGGSRSRLKMGPEGIADATALRRGGSRSPLQGRSRGIADATALRRGGSRSPLQGTSSSVAFSL